MNSSGCCGASGRTAAAAAMAVMPFTMDRDRMKEKYAAACWLLAASKPLKRRSPKNYKSPDELHLLLAMR
jgi:hypothetical protein